MAEIGVYVERYTVSSGYEMNSLMRFAQVARKMGHRVDFLFRPDMYKIPEYDAIFIRALTDPLNSAYVAARTAQLNGVRVIDDPDSIFICCDKVNMYKRLLNANVPIPETRFLGEEDLTPARGRQLLKDVSTPIVLKAPNSSFSMYVECARTPEEFAKVGRRFFRRADRIIAQKFVQSQFDWRVGIAGDQVLYVCQYMFPRKQWKILTYTPDGKTLTGPVKGVRIEDADPKLLDMALRAGAAIGNGLYGVDLKQVGSDYVVIEVNDNPTINAGDEDQKSGNLYERLVNFVLNGVAEGR